MKLLDYINHLSVLVVPATYNIIVCKRIKRKDIDPKGSYHPVFKPDDVVHRSCFLEIEGDYDSITDIIKNFNKEVVLEFMGWYMSEKDAESITRYDDVDALKNMPADVEISALVDRLSLAFYIPEDSETSPDVEYHDDANDYSVDDIYSLFNKLMYPGNGIKFVMFDSDSTVFKQNNTLDTEMFHEVCAQVKFSSIGYMKCMEGCFDNYCVEAVIPSINTNTNDFEKYEDEYMVVYLIKK